MMMVTREQRRTDPASTKMAHNSAFVRASFPSTATMQKVRIRIAKKEGERGAIQSFFRSPQIAPKPTEREAPFLQPPITVRAEQLTSQSRSKTDAYLYPFQHLPPPPGTRNPAIPTSRTPNTLQGRAGSYL